MSSLTSLSCHEAQNESTSVLIAVSMRARTFGVLSERIILMEHICVRMYGTERETVAGGEKQRENKRVGVTYKTD